MHDQYFTPNELAKTAIEAVRIRKVEVVADFAAGHGDLLAAARARWPMSSTIGCDVDPVCVRVMKSSKEVSYAVKCDFLSSASRERSATLRAHKGVVDLAVLNPPFSGIGAASLRVWTGDRFVTCSKAMAFAYTSLAYLRPGGELVAVLPASCLTSVKDKVIRELCSTISSEEVVRKFSSRAFIGCVASTIVVRYRRGIANASVSDAIPSSHIGEEESVIRVRLVRGCTPVFRAENGLAGSRFPFIHSTDIAGREVLVYTRGVKSTSRVVVGPVVLLTRVGSPASRKCAIYNCEQPIAISDCVIALQCNSLRGAERVRKRILSRWPILSDQYGGTCAPYITIEKLSLFLKSVGVYPE